MKVKDRKFTVLGLGKSGIAAAEKLKDLGAHVFLSDSKAEKSIENIEYIKKNFKCEFGGHSDKIYDCEIIVKSPGIPNSINVIKKAAEKKIEIISEIELGYRIKNNKSKIIAVTGSNGKSTTVSLIADILRNAGFRTLLAGNIGEAFTSFPIEKDNYDFIVLELSSFQLENIKEFKADTAVILNITPDHLNRYENNFEKYAEAKWNIFNNQSSKDSVVLNKEDNMTLKMLNKFELIADINFFSMEDKDAEIVSDNDFIKFSDEKFRDIDFSKAILRGAHNKMNLMAAALAVKKYLKDEQPITKSMTEFKTLEHRLEYVTTKRFISFINDSKATNTKSVEFALTAFDKPLNIILGGSDKGEDFSVLNNLLEENCRSLHLIGSTTEKMKKAFKTLDKIEIFEHKTLEEAVKSAYENAQEADFVLLSPACASYDMFDNFMQRGQIFKKIVSELE